jgi:hypothetical protein
MKPIKFKEQNIIFAENQPEYQQLPAFKNNTTQGEVISCWKLTIYERIKLLITGKLYVELLTFNKPLTPSYLTVNKSDLFIKPNKHSCNCVDCKCKK